MAPADHHGMGRCAAQCFPTSAFQALTHIGAATLWVLPVILCSARALLLFAAASAGLHVILSHWFWYDTLHQWHVIDGGPLGFLTWTLPVVAGALACDAVHAASGSTLRRLFQASAATMLAGYGLACLTQGGVLAAPPFFKPWHPPDLWTMSQRAGSVSYSLSPRASPLRFMPPFTGGATARAAP